jgi:TonB family protein
MSFEKRSGNRFFDDSTLRAVKKSSPFPPLPSWIMDSSIEIGIRFHSAELR